MSLHVVISSSFYCIDVFAILVHTYVKYLRPLITNYRIAIYRLFLLFYSHLTIFITNKNARNWIGR